MRNPAKLLALKKQYEAFAERHPKFLRYLAYIIDHYMEEDAVLDVTATAPDGRSLHGNAKLSAEDVAFLQEVRRTLGGG